MMTPIRLLSLVLSLVAAALLLTACAAGEAETREETRPIPLVEAVQARSGSIPLSDRVSGTVRAENQVAIRAEISAPIIDVMVRSGDEVRQGQPLVRLDDRDVREQLRQAEANVRLAEATAAEAAARVGELEAQTNRARSLAEQALISRAELDTLEAQLAASRASARQAQARIDQAEAAVAEQRTALARTVVRAPVSGRIGERNAETGMIANPSTVLFVVGDLDELVVEVPLTQEMLQHVRPGTPVRISSPALGGQPIEASLSRISPFLSAGSFSTTAEIDVENEGGGLRPGMFVTVDLLRGSTTDSTLVPASALWEDPATGIMQVYVVGGAGADAQAPVKVEARAVEIVGEGSGVAGVTSVREGEWVVVAGQHLLAREDAAAARVRRGAWEKVVGLQRLQREDLLAGFLATQQSYARKEGAEPPSAEAYLAGGATTGER